MEGGDLSAVVGPPPKARRGSGAAIYEKYLNIKKNALVEVDGPADPTNKPLEISNSTDEQELEAGEVVSTEENDAACANGSSGPGVSVAAPTDGGMSEPEMEEPPQTQPKPQQAASDTPPPEASAASAPAAGSNIQLTAVGTSYLAVHRAVVLVVDAVALDAMGSTGVLEMALAADLAVLLVMALVGDQVAHLVVTLSADLAVHRVGILTEDLAVHRAVVLVVDAVALDAMGSTGVQEMALADAPHRRWTDVMTSVADHQ
ncbi:hypothetical protein PRNP1_013917 [Phytophthora ramorum]